MLRGEEQNGKAQRHESFKILSFRPLVSKTKKRNPPRSASTFQNRDSRWVLPFSVTILSRLYTSGSTPRHKYIGVAHVDDYFLR